MKNPATSTALSEVRKIADLMPSAQPVFDHLCARLMATGKTPAFFAEARDHLSTAQEFATRNGQPMLGGMYATAAKAMAKKASHHV